jgi:hypothetical protein
VPRHDPQTKQLRLDARQLALLLTGVRLDSVQHRRRYSPPLSAAS